MIIRKLTMESNPANEIEMEDDFLFFSLLYTSITILFAMAVLTKFLTNEFRFGFRSILSLTVLFIGEPLCHLFVKGPLGVIIFGLGCLFIYSILPASHLPAKHKTVLITGCDSGFGHALVKKLDSIGMIVFAGCLYKDGPGAIELQNNCSERVTILQMDVTKQKEIDNAFECISAKVGDKGLWGLVNNAGIWYVGEIQMTPEEIFRHVMDVNFYGMLKTTKRFIPLISKSKGRIVNMSSIAGKMSFEGLGPYCITKAAIESYTDTLRLEMAKWGVKVLTIQPSGYKTAALEGPLLEARREALWTAMSPSDRALYGRRYLEAMYARFALTAQRCPSDLIPVVRACVSALLSRHPLPRCPVGRGSYTFLLVLPMLPVILADRLLHVLGSATVDFLPAALQQPSGSSQGQTQGGEASLLL